MPSGLFVAFVSGTLWGILGAACAAPWFGPAAWAACLTGPFAGLGVAALHRRLAPRRVRDLLPVATITLTLTAATFATVAQVVAELRAAPVPLYSPGPLTQATGTWGSLTRVLVTPGYVVVFGWMSGLFVLLWPVALVTHFVYFLAADPPPSEDES